MKITLNSNNEIHRKIAKLFVGCEFQYLHTGKMILVGEFCDYEEDEKGLMNFVAQDIDEPNCLQYLDSITIDLDTAEPDLRMAIGEAMEFESGGRNVGSITHYFTQVNYEDSLCLSNFSGDLGVADIQLSREWLESQNIKVEDK